LIKDALLGKANIPKSDEEINEKTEEGKVLMKNADLNEIVYTESILSIDIRSSSSKIVSASSKDVRVESTLMETLHRLRIISRRSLILFLPLH
jgi:hypothetical protein